ncbi:MAG TPA: DUF427 domain-containing protein [Burkholderiales bacterium]|jgi:uncharacterized protein (DUF427 family)
MPRALWNGAVIAEAPAEATHKVEGNIYFPPSAINKAYLRPSDYHTVCPWKGTASYYTVEVNGEKNQNAAWYYPAPSDAAKQIKDHVAFWKGVQVEA